MGFKHRKITPLWPRANSECERFMRSIGKAIRAANTEHRSWKQEIHTFLRNYRATPHGNTGLSHAELLFRRKINTKLPNLTNKTNNDNNVRVNDTKRKQKMKEYFDLKRNTKPADLKVGDIVLMKQEKKNKLSTPFNPEPMTIKNKKGSMITAAAENKEITRNSSFFKKIGKPVLCDDEIDDILESGKSIRVITKLPNSEQSSKGKVKTHKDINRQNQSTTGKL